MHILSGMSSLGLSLVHPTAWVHGTRQTKSVAEREREKCIIDLTFILALEVRTSSSWVKLKVAPMPSVPSLVTRTTHDLVTLGKHC